MNVVVLRSLSYRLFHHSATIKLCYTAILYLQAINTDGHDSTAFIGLTFRASIPCLKPVQETSKAGDRPRTYAEAANFLAEDC